MPTGVCPGRYTRNLLPKFSDRSRTFPICRAPIAYASFWMNFRRTSSCLPTLFSEEHIFVAFKAGLWGYISKPARFFLLPAECYPGGESRRCADEFFWWLKRVVRSFSQLDNPCLPFPKGNTTSPMLCKGYSYRKIESGCLSVLTPCAFTLRIFTGKLKVNSRHTIKSYQVGMV